MFTILLKVRSYDKYTSYFFVDYTKGPLGYKKSMIGEVPEIWAQTKSNSLFWRKNDDGVHPWWIEPKSGKSYALCETASGLGFYHIGKYSSGKVPIAAFYLFVIIYLAY
ncbi:unnamed protein product [Oikopleura dioica]|uniref:Uncharacterized protein n=1 Tax=Oikopleura dioica TaxID=34765 RepID=E4X1U6_OIKDI|nr:unnamed protein product [Oikopleura dioica]